MSIRYWKPQMIHEQARICAVCGGPITDRWIAGLHGPEHLDARMCVACARTLKDAEIARLRKIIEDAPHDRYCEFCFSSAQCNCWKAALSRIEAK